MLRTSSSKSAVLFSSVAVFFGATNVIDLCMAPMDILSSLLLSMLSGYTHLKDLGNRQRYTVLVGAAVIAVGATSAAFFIGPLALSVVFPKFANESAEILQLLVMVIPCVAIIGFSRPFVLKFGPIKFIPVLNFVTLVSHLPAAVILIPKFGIKGAAISYDIGFGISAISYVVALVWTFKLGRKSKTAVEFVRCLDRIEGSYRNACHLTINKGIEK